MKCWYILRIKCGILINLIVWNVAGTVFRSTQIFICVPSNKLVLLSINCFLSRICTLKGFSIVTLY